MAGCVHEGRVDAAIVKREAAALQGDVVGCVVALVVSKHAAFEGDVGCTVVAGEASSGTVSMF